MYEISNLLDIPKSGIYGLLNPFEKKMYIGYSSNLLPHIVSIVEELRLGGFRIPKMNEDRYNLRFVILETGDDIETLKLHIKYWEDTYRREGWYFYDPAKRKYLEYKVEIVISLVTETADVILFNTRGDGKLVGRFSKVEEANEFVALYYNKESNLYNYPIYAANALTKACMLSGIRGIG